MTTAAGRIFTILRTAYGPQGWWPLASRANQPGFDDGGYFLAGAHLPETDKDRFEIFCGAILTQNTTWRNVALVLKKLHDQGMLDPEVMVTWSESELAQEIRSTGYHNQKARKLLLALQVARAGRWFESATNAPDRSTLLALWGIGPETADSMLLYIWGVPSFVVDAYTRRLLGRLGWDWGFAPQTAGYSEIQAWFQTELGHIDQAPDSARTVLYNEYHALIVHHAKEHCSARPKCRGCPLWDHCGGRENS